MRILTLALALVFVVATGTWVQTASAQMATTIVDQQGHVVSIDPSANVVVLDNGRMYRVTPGTTLYVDNQPAPLGALRAGDAVIVRSGQPVVYQNGQYLAAAQAPGAPPAPSVVVTSAPPVNPGIAQTVYGRVKDVDRDGVVKIETDRDSFKVKLAPQAAAQIHEGDTVQLNLTILPPGTPAASPSLR